MGKRYTYSKLTAEFRIVIPKIQRDYAYGRSDNRAVDVRKNIIDNMVAAADPERHETKFFYFVYGRVEEDKRNGTKTLYPFDGQQRLTTLFLFHLYIASKVAGGRQPECVEAVSYATRLSSKDFSDRLSQTNIIPTDEDESISDFISYQPWFDSEWEKDPTIKGMLVMLDDIHSVLRDRQWDWRQAWNNLSNIEFEYIDMEENKLPDSVYVKMNSRGKKLTSYENFKASLEELLSDNEGRRSLKERFVGTKEQANIDGVWLDFFYAFKGGKPDALMLAVFRRHLLNIYVAAGKKDADDSVAKYLEKMLKDDEFVSFDIYVEALKAISGGGNGIENGLVRWLTPLFDLFDALSDNWKEIRELTRVPWGDWNLVTGDIGDTNTETLKSRVAFFGVMCYFEHRKADLSSLKDWMRIVWNLAENSSVDTNWDGVVRMVQDVSSCLKGDLMANVAQYGGHQDSDQMKEEVMKAKVWNQSAEDITAAESYAFFKGSISFLFDDKGFFDNTRWANARKFFDNSGKKDKGVSEDYQKGGKMLLRAVLSRCPDDEQSFKNMMWGSKYVFTNSPRWKDNFLTGKNFHLWKDAIGQVMSGNVDVGGDVYRDVQPLCVPGVLEWATGQSWVFYRDSGSRHHYKAIWPYGNPTGMLCFNSVLAQLHKSGAITYDAGKESQIGDWCVGKDVPFTYHSKEDGDWKFKWMARPDTTKEYIVQDDKGEWAVLEPGSFNHDDGKDITVEFAAFLKPKICMKVWRDKVRDYVTALASVLHSAEVWIWQWERIVIDLKDTMDGEIFVDIVFDDLNNIDAGGRLVLWSRLGDEDNEKARKAVKTFLTKTGLIHNAVKTDEGRASIATFIGLDELRKALSDVFSRL